MPNQTAVITVLDLNRTVETVIGHFTRETSIDYRS